ncbi:MAG: DNA primase [Marinobacter sp.]|nr:DNA primase [Marinobacter sp.]
MSGLIPQSFIENLLDRIDLADLVGSRITLKKAGNSFKACCPFHDEKTPSFHVRPDKGFYHCFGCGAHGDAISFIRELDGMAFTDAVEELARRAGLEVPYDQSAKREMAQAKSLTDALDFASQYYQQALQQPAGKLAQDYLQRRGLDSQIIARYQLGYAPGEGAALANAANAELLARLLETGTVSDKFGRSRDLFRNRVMFPIRNTRGRTVAFGGRTLGDDKAKYINSPESDVFHKSREVYGLYEAQQAIRQLDRLLVVEGYMDVIALAQHGIDYAVATLGTATNQDSLTALFKQVRHLIFCFDGDDAGYRAADRALENALELIKDGIHLQFLMLPQGEDPDTLVRKEGKDKFLERVAGAAPLSRFLFERQGQGLDLELAEHRGELRARVEPLLNKIPRCSLRDAMWHEMMRLCGGRRPWQQAWDKKKTNEAPVDVRLSRDSMLCLALLESPDLATEIRAAARNDRNLSTCAHFADWILAEELTSRRQIIRALATNRQAQAEFKGLFKGVEHVPSRENILAASREILSPNEEAVRKQRISQLLTQAKRINDLPPEAREELKSLTSARPS